VGLSLSGCSRPEDLVTAASKPNQAWLVGSWPWTIVGVVGLDAWPLPHASLANDGTG
jgi:hypothetical protein